MIAVIIGLSRRIREAGRQGVLPWTKFWVSTKRFGTPLGPYLVIWALTALLIVAVPAGDAFTFGMYNNTRRCCSKLCAACANEY
jgi:amino acid transporter